MHIVFVSNYINHHQIPLSDKLFELSKGKYTFIQTEPMTKERIALGWNAGCEREYLKDYLGNEDECNDLILNCDCVIFGGTEEQQLIIPRLEAHKFTIRYSERLYKQGRWKFISPRGLKQKYYDHTRFNDAPVYLLCAGAYVKGDFNLIHAYKNKMLKFGYFPKTELYDDLDNCRHDNDKCEILWAARFIDWKHPEMMIQLAESLRCNSVDCHITMIGNGELLEHTKNMVKEKDLDRYFTFTGSLAPYEVRKQMRHSDVFISTSDCEEGWGAVINEAMNSGCVTIAAKEIGSAPYLIKDGINGYLYKSKNVKELIKKVLIAISDKGKANTIRNNAYKTIKELWNADVAAERLYDFIVSKEHDVNKYKDGPVSKA